LFVKLFSEHPMLKQHLYTITYAQFLGPEAQTQIKNSKMDELNKIYQETAKDMTYQNCLDRLEQLIADTEAEVSTMICHIPERMVF
jgi:hypothetical protein